MFSSRNVNKIYATAIFLFCDVDKFIVETNMTNLRTTTVSIGNWNLWLNINNNNKWYGLSLTHDMQVDNVDNGWVWWYLALVPALVLVLRILEPELPVVRTSEGRGVSAVWTVRFHTHRQEVQLSLVSSQPWHLCRDTKLLTGYFKVDTF